MTQDEIISMAREVGAPGWWTGETDSNVPGRDWLSRFAALVAAKAVAEEREACAQLAAQTVCDLHIPTGVKIYGTRAAQAIRARAPMSADPTPALSYDTARCQGGADKLCDTCLRFLAPGNPYRQAYMSPPHSIERGECASRIPQGVRNAG